MTGPIPVGALQKFLEREMKKDQVDRGVRKVVRKYHWYTRHHMWAMAKRLFGADGTEVTCRRLDSLDDLEAWEFEKCLAEVDFYLRNHSSLRAKGLAAHLQAAGLQA